ncbi:MAG: helix-turn-helix transcriptional regulator [Candidatus Binataceae bacterium]
MKLKAKLGQVLRERRRALGLTQRVLAKKLGVKGSHVAYLESGQRKPSLALLGRLVDTLGLDGQQLFISAFPEAKALVGLGTTSAPPKRPAQAWRELLSERSLLTCYQVTPHEFRALKQISLLGYVLSPREFLAILTLIRKPEER